MGRTIITAQDLADRGGRPTVSAAAAARPPDDFLDRLIKYIPADVIAAYLTIDNILKGGLKDPQRLPTYLWAVFAILLILTPLYLWRVAGVTKWEQIGLSAVAFAVWVFALGGPFTQLDVYDPILAAVILPLASLVIAIFQPNK